MYWEGPVCRICGGPLLRKKPGQPGPQKQRHDSCYKKLYRSSPRGRMSALRSLTRKRAMHAALNLRPHEKVTDSKFKLPKRKRYYRERKYISRHVCACGKEFLAGSAAVRCWQCEVEHRRKMHRMYYRRSKLRSKGNDQDR